MIVRLTWPGFASVETVVSVLAEDLKAQGYEVVTERKGYRVMMYRNIFKTWTQVYTGLTRRAKLERNFLKVAGPEQSMMDGFIFYPACEGVEIDGQPPEPTQEGELYQALMKAYRKEQEDEEATEV